MITGLWGTNVLVGGGEVLGVLPLPTPVYTLDRRYDHRPLGYQRPGGGGGGGEVLGVLPLPTPVYTLDRRYDHTPLGYQRPGLGTC